MLHGRTRACPVLRSFDGDHRFRSSCRASTISIDNQHIPTCCRGRTTPCRSKVHHPPIMRRVLRRCILLSQRIKVVMVGVHDVEQTRQLREWAALVIGVALPTASDLQLIGARQTMQEVQAKASAFQAVVHHPMDLEVALRPRSALLRMLSTLEAAMALRVVPAFRPTVHLVAHYQFRPSAPAASCLAPATVLEWIREVHMAHPLAPHQEAAGNRTKALTKGTKADTKVGVEAEVALEEEVEEVMCASGRRSSRVTATVVLVQHLGLVMVFQLELVALRSGHPNKHVLGGKRAIRRTSMMRRPNGRRSTSRNTSSLHWVWLRPPHAGAQISWTLGRSPARPGKA